MPTLAFAADATTDAASAARAIQPLVDAWPVGAAFLIVTLCVLGLVRFGYMPFKKQENDAKAAAAAIEAKAKTDAVALEVINDRAARTEQKEIETLRLQQAKEFSTAIERLEQLGERVNEALKAAGHA